MYGNPYARNYIPNYGMNQQNNYEQNMYDQIDNQINQLVGMRNQLKNNSMQQTTPQQPTAINQTFQLSPNGTYGMKYATSIDEVAKEAVFFDTPFFSKDMSVMWLKNAKGEIKAYELNEIIEKDEKDMQIELLQAQQEEKDNKIDFLQAQINNLRKEMRMNEQYVTNVDESEDETNTTKLDGATRKTTKSEKSTSVSRVSKSKTE